MKWFHLVLAVSLMTVPAFQASAAEEEVLPGMAKKFGYGVVDTVTGIVELPVQTVKGYKKGVGFISHEPSSKAVGTVLGFFRGIGHAAGRTLHGAIDVVTFWTANREDNEGIGIPLDAEFAWQQGEAHSLFKPSLKEGLMPYPRKLGYGLADGFLGLVDVPAQVVAGARADQPVIGVPVGAVRGLWFGVSRITTGLGDAILFLVPNPEETHGYAYSHDLPWGAFAEDGDN